MADLRQVLVGMKKMTTETGAGQWGSALAYACQKFGIDLEVFMIVLLRLFTIPFNLFYVPRIRISISIDS